MKRRFAAYRMYPFENELDRRNCRVPCESTISQMSLKWFDVAFIILYFQHNFYIFLTEYVN